jgi:hypothetical protein
MKTRKSGCRSIPRASAIGRPPPEGGVAGRSSRRGPAAPTDSGEHQAVAAVTLPRGASATLRWRSRPKATGAQMKTQLCVPGSTTWAKRTAFTRGKVAA